MEWLQPSPLHTWHSEFSCLLHAVWMDTKWYGDTVDGIETPCPIQLCWEGTTMATAYTLCIPYALTVSWVLQPLQSFHQLVEMGCSWRDIKPQSSSYTHMYTKHKLSLCTQIWMLTFLGDAHLLQVALCQPNQILNIIQSAVALSPEEMCIFCQFQRFQKVGNISL